MLYEIFVMICHERYTLILKYKKSTTLLHRLIKYQFGVFPLNSQGCRSSQKPYKTYKTFLNSCLLLALETSGLSYTINVLYLSISTNTQGIISLQTYQRAMNLYIYLTYHSTHPTVSTNKSRAQEWAITALCLLDSFRPFGK